MQRLHLRSSQVSSQSITICHGVSESPKRCRQRLCAKARDPKPSEALCKVISSTTAGFLGPQFSRSWPSGSPGVTRPREPHLDGLFHHIGFRHIKACLKFHCQTYRYIYVYVASASELATCS